LPSLQPLAFVVLAVDWRLFAVERNWTVAAIRSRALGHRSTGKRTGLHGACLTRGVCGARAKHLGRRVAFVRDGALVARGNTVRRSPVMLPCSSNALATCSM